MSTFLPSSRFFRVGKASFGALAFTALFLGSAVSIKAQTLLAGWSFNNQTSQTTALTADEGTLAGSATLTAASSSGNELTLNGDGTVTLGPHEVLYSTAINSTSYASLLSGVTVYVNFTTNGTTTSTSNEAAFGFTQATPVIGGTVGSAGSFAAAGAGSFGLQMQSTFIRPIGWDSSGASITGSQDTSVSMGSVTSAAIEFSTTGTSYTTLDVLNGGSATSKTTSSTANLASFTDFAIGRLLSGGNDSGTGYVVNDIQIWSGDLTPTQIDALQPLAVPEPPSFTLLLIGCSLFFGFKWITSRPRRLA